MQIPDFRTIILAHQARYPCMQPQDFAKLAFQHTYGPEHMILDARDAAQRLLAEWQTASTPDAPCNPEPIGNGLCRFHLSSVLFSEDNAAALAELFVQSAQEHTGTRAHLETRLSILTALDVNGMDTWLAAYRKQGCPPVHHSDVFRNTYHPHYRVILQPLATRFIKQLTING